jgi:hypothetical protein
MAMVLANSIGSGLRLSSGVPASFFPRRARMVQHDLHQFIMHSHTPDFRQ